MYVVLSGSLRTFRLGGKSMPWPIGQFNPRLPLGAVGSCVQSNVFADFNGFCTLLHNASVQSKVQKEHETVREERYFAAKQPIYSNSTLTVGKHHKANHAVQHCDSADLHTENCVSTVYGKNVKKNQLSHQFYWIRVQESNRCTRICNGIRL
jgi:hypothetical protein